MFDELSEKLEATFARLRGRGVLSEADIKEGLREVRRVLLEADVNFQLTREFLERVEKKAVGVTGLVLTKLDGTAKGGIVIAIARKLGLPIRFIGVGEQAEDFGEFDARAFATALVSGNTRASG